jgi:hypothetical protein
MEPLNEISWENFYSYTDEKQFTYGFNIFSLFQMIKSQPGIYISNPYNREKITYTMRFHIISLYNISCILFEDFQKEHLKSFPKYKPPIINTSVASTNVSNTENILHTAVIGEPRIFNLETEYMPQLRNPQLLLDVNMCERYRYIVEIRAKPIQHRIEELFIQIDQLGNYTQSVWFSQLEVRGYTRLYRCLYDIWTYRSQMTDETKNGISPFYNPFEGIFNRMIQNVMVDYNQMKLACLIAMENMVYPGIDEDHRKIGAFHALSALTVVSMGARNAMPWLYESVMY